MESQDNEMLKLEAKQPPTPTPVGKEKALDGAGESELSRQYSSSRTEGGVGSVLGSFCRGTPEQLRSTF